MKLRMCVILFVALTYASTSAASVITPEDAGLVMQAEAVGFVLQVLGAGGFGITEGNVLTAVGSVGSTTWTVDILNEPFPGGQLLTLDIDGTFDSTTDIATFSGTGSFGALGMTISDGEGVFLASDQVYFSETVSIGNPVRGWVAKQLLRIGAGGIIDWILEKDEKKQTLPKTYNLSNIVNSNITINQNSGGVTVTTTVKADKYGKTTVKTSSTPEPCSLIIWGIGTLGIVGYRWRRRKLFRNDPFRES